MQYARRHTHHTSPLITFLFAFDVSHVAAKLFNEFSLFLVIVRHHGQREEQVGHVGHPQRRQFRDTPTMQFNVNLALERLPFASGGEGELSVVEGGSGGRGFRLGYQTEK